MPKALNKILALHILTFCFFIIGCGGNRIIPDAPPPYHSYSAPGYDAISNQSSSYGPSSPFSKLPPPPAAKNPSNYSTQELAPQTYSEVPSSYVPRTEQKTFPTSSERYSIVAKANIWVLVQDEYGAEVDWKRLSKDETMSITHPRPVTVTCSSATKVDIFDQRGKKIENSTSQSGIAIIRLP